MRKEITAAERRHQDAQRQAGMKVAAQYANRLASLRRAELRRVLKICRESQDPLTWRRIIENNLSEAGYIQGWYTGLFVGVGVTAARDTARALSRGKADPTGIWERYMYEFATQRAGENIVSVTGTFRDQVIRSLEESLEGNVNISVEALAQSIYEGNSGIALWSCRRIAQTESMIGMAEANAMSAASLGVRFVKQWCISGVGNTRETHQAMDGKMVDQDEYFELPDCKMLYPHDNSLKPPAEEIINCACTCIRRSK